MSRWPQPLGWHDYAEALLPDHADAYLDYGCGPCGMLKRVMPRARRTCGVDVDPAGFPQIPGAELYAVPEGVALPFDNGTFDLITCLEVIEHVADERDTFAELARLLRAGGMLILTTPHKGWLTWMDPGNIKFAFPRLHRLAHRIKGSRDYDDRFGKQRQESLGMISDISANQEKPWHRHYRYEEIRALACDSLRTEKVEIRYPAMRAFWCIDIVWRAVFGRDAGWVRFFTSRLSRQETKGGDQLVIVFRKI